MSVLVWCIHNEQILGAYLKVFLKLLYSLPPCPREHNVRIADGTVPRCMQTQPPPASTETEELCRAVTIDPNVYVTIVSNEPHNESVRL